MGNEQNSGCRVLTVLNLKGGVGKTHTAWLLASACQDRGKRVLLIDTDTQDVLRQFPSKEALAISHELDKLQGLLIRDKA